MATGKGPPARRIRRGALSLLTLNYDSRWTSRFAIDESRKGLQTLLNFRNVGTQLNRPKEADIPVRITVYDTSPNEYTGTDNTVARAFFFCTCTIIYRFGHGLARDVVTH